MNMNFRILQAKAEELEAEIEELRKLKYAMCDEEEAEELYGEDINSLESELSELYGEMDTIDEALLTREYYAAVL